MPDPPDPHPDPFADLRVIVAGGTSGIGLACVRLLRARGARVVAIGRHEPPSADPPTMRVDSPRCELSEWDDHPAVLADLTDPDLAAEACAMARGQLGPVDAVIHTIGGSARSAGDGPLRTCTPAGWQAALRLNLDTAFHVLRWSVAELAQRPRDTFGQRGSVALVGSVLANHPSAQHFGTIGYAVAKAGLEGLVRGAAASSAADGIRVNMLKPGLVATPMAARAIGDPEIGEFLRAKQPLTAGAIPPEACAQAILGLIDPRNVGLTGAILTLDGGWSVTDPVPRFDG